MNEYTFPLFASGSFKYFNFSDFLLNSKNQMNSSDYPSRDLEPMNTQKKMVKHSLAVKSLASRYAKGTGTKICYSFCLKWQRKAKREKPIENDETRKSHLIGHIYPRQEHYFSAILRRYDNQSIQDRRKEQASQTLKSNSAAETVLILILISVSLIRVLTELIRIWIEGNRSYQTNIGACLLLFRL